MVKLWISQIVNWIQRHHIAKRRRQMKSWNKWRHRSLPRKKESNMSTSRRSSKTISSGLNLAQLAVLVISKVSFMVDTPPASGSTASTWLPLTSKIWLSMKKFQTSILNTQATWMVCQKMYQGRHHSHSSHGSASLFNLRLATWISLSKTTMRWCDS